jgi:iron complex outermembrane receptor protein
MPVFELDGGVSELAVGASVRYEAVDAPSGNDDFSGPTQRYFRQNAFGTIGSRRAYALFAEWNLPVLETLDVNLSSRFDTYSSGQEAFSPKVGARWQVFDEIALRATYSLGFRIPSFAEANALPTTGFVSNTIALFNDGFLAQYGCSLATYNTCPTYITQGSFGQTTIASPNLEPEDAESFTLGAILQPFEGFSFAVDYYDIEKTNTIIQPSNTPALQAYYSGQPIPAGYTVIPDGPDPAFPLALPRVAFVQAQLVNANKYSVQGWDFAANFRTDLDDDISLDTYVDVSYISRLTTEFLNGRLERYDGTLGNFNLTAGSGTPAWRGTWSTTVSFRDWADLTGTVNYYSGYNLSAMDQGTGYKDCGLGDGTTPCDIDGYTTVDLNGQLHVSENATLYLNVLNVADEMPPVDVIGNYGIAHYNPVQAGTGILGRYFRAGVRVQY